MSQHSNDSKTVAKSNKNPFSDFLQTGLYGTVLVVDDDPSVREIVVMVLRETHHVVEAPTGRAALDLIEGGKVFDVIVSDIAMPEMDGIDFYQELKSIYPSQARRMIFMTGAAVTQRMLEFVAATASPVIAKPFDLEGMKTLVIYKIDSQGLASED